MALITKKRIAAVVIGPLALLPAYLVSSSLQALFLFNNLPERIEHIFTNIGIALIGLVWAYPLTLGYGLPSAAILQKLKMFNLPAVLLISLIPASVICVLFVPIFGVWLMYSYSSMAIALGCWYAYKWA